MSRNKNQKVPVRNAPELAANLIGTVNHIAELRRMEKPALNKDCLRCDIIRVSMDGFWILNKEGGFLDVNDAYCRLIGYTREDLLNMVISDVEAMETSDETARHIQKVISSGYDRFETRHRCKNGQVLDIEVSCQFRRDPQGDLFVCFLRDISERRLMAEMHREWSSHLESAREEERTRIAHEIHDEFGNLLATLKLDVNWLAKRTPRSDQEQQEVISSMSEIIDQAIKCVGKISTDLHPSILDNLGLLPAIRWQVMQISKSTGFSCELGLPDIDKLEMDGERTIAVYRILQEALTNILKHSNSSRARIEVQLNEHALIMTVSDNGKGITRQDQFKPHSYGIIGMNERARHFGGELRISGEPDTGTVLVLTMPLDSTSATAAK